VAILGEMRVLSLIYSYVAVCRFYFMAVLHHHHHVPEGLGMFPVP